MQCWFRVGSALQIWLNISPSLCGRVCLLGGIDQSVVWRGNPPLVISENWIKSISVGPGNKRGRQTSTSQKKDYHSNWQATTTTILVSDAACTDLWVKNNFCKINYIHVPYLNAPCTCHCFAPRACLNHIPKSAYHPKHIDRDYKKCLVYKLLLGSYIYKRNTFNLEKNRPDLLKIIIGVCVFYINNISWTSYPLKPWNSFILTINTKGNSS